MEHRVSMYLDHRELKKVSSSGVVCTQTVGWQEWGGTVTCKDVYYSNSLLHMKVEHWHKGMCNIFHKLYSHLGVPATYIRGCLLNNCMVITLLATRACRYAQ